MDPEIPENNIRKYSEHIRPAETGLPHDAATYFGALGSFSKVIGNEQFMGIILKTMPKNVPTLEDHLSKYENWQEAIKDYDPKRVVEFNSLVGEYNDTVSEMIDKKDWPGLKNLWERISMLVYGKIK